jgi:tRNA pseudouridine55 synthase
VGRAQREPGPDGVAVVDKPAGWTSHDVVARSRGLLGTRKVGHAGTLDPDATGVLVLGVGKGTKLLRFLSPLGKTYVGEVVLGVETSTLDAAGEVTARHDMAGVTLADVQETVAVFRGEIMQVPPMVSALKVGGRRLHELAREGIEVEREARPVTVHRLEVRAAMARGSEPDGPRSRADRRGDQPSTVAGSGAVAGLRREDGDQSARVLGGDLAFEIEVECSAGTYIRTLAADIGTALGGGAHLHRLRRTAVGPFGLDDACSLEALGPDRLLPLSAAVRHLDLVEVGPDVAADVATGKVLTDAVLGGEDGLGGGGPWAVLDGDGEVLAVYERYGGGTAKPSVVLVAR